MSYRVIAKVTNSSITTIHRTLKPQSLSTNSEDEVRTVSSELNGELASRLFRLFKSGKSLIDVVIQEKIHPEIVSRYYQEWGQLNYSQFDPKGLTLLWFAFEASNSINEIADLIFGTSERYLSAKGSFKEYLVRLIVSTSEISMKDAYWMLDVTQMREKWKRLEEFYPNADREYMETLRKVWNYRDNV